MAKENKETNEEADVFATGEQFARDRAEGWFTFAKVGDRIGGVIRDMFETPAKDGFQAQRVFTLEKKDGSLWNVGLKRTEYVLTRTNALQIGDELGITFEKEIPPKKKGFHPAKSMVFVNKKNGDRLIGQQAQDLQPSAPVEVSEDTEQNKADDDAFFANV